MSIIILLKIKWINKTIFSIRKNTNLKLFWDFCISSYDRRVLSGKNAKTSGTAEFGPTEPWRISTWYQGQGHIRNVPSAYTHSEKFSEISSQIIHYE